MKLYVGSRDYRPEGYTTVDIDPENRPDIVADITKMTMVKDSSCVEVVAGHVLEHLEWPDSFAAMAEFSRILKHGGIVKIAVPDMDSLLRMLLSGDSAFHVMGLIYGLGGRVNNFERHRYGFTVGMLVDILETLGFGRFDWWNSDLADASNGWAPSGGLNGRIGISLNLQAEKIGAPTVDPTMLYQALINASMEDFATVVARQDGHDMQTAARLDRVASAKVLQFLHFKLIDAHQRIRYLENELRTQSGNRS